MRALVVGVNKLYSAVQQIMNDHEKNPMEELPASLLDEWMNVFASELQLGSFETWMTFASMYISYLISLRLKNVEYYSQIHNNF